MSANLQAKAASDGTLWTIVRGLLWTKVPQIPADLDLTGKTALVTGSNVGLGFEASRHLLQHKLSRLIMGVRSVKKGDAAAAKLRAQFPEAAIEVWQVDMQSYNSVQALAARVGKEIDRLHIAILNAGMASPGRWSAAPSSAGTGRSSGRDV